MLRRSPTDVAGWNWGPAELNPYATFRDRKPDDLIDNAVLVYRGTFQTPLLAAQSKAILARAMLQGAQAAKAVPLARAAVAAEPGSADLHSVLAHTLLAAGQVTEGQQELATAIRLAQTVHPAYQRLLLRELSRPLLGQPAPAQ